MEGYKIGAVSTLTGIAPNTIRVWERRYEAVTPARGERGGRIYNIDDINRLKTLQTCIDLGDSIGQIAGLSDADLTDRLQRLEATQPSRTHSIPSENTTLANRLMVAGGSLPTRIRPLKLPHFTDSQYFSDLDKMISSVESDPITHKIAGTKEPARHNHDLVCITEHDSLNRDLCQQLVSFVENTQPSVLIVCYSFGMSSHVEQLHQAGILLLREPADNNALLTLLHAPNIIRSHSPEMKVNLDKAVPALRFSKRQLLSLSRIRSSIACECPQHIAELLVSLNAFERYSAMCEDQNDDDAVLHAMLLKATAHARLTMENALAELLEAENITLPDI